MITAEGYQPVTYTNIEVCNITNIAGLTYEDNQLPMEYSLRQNYPNPFNPTTTINFDLPVSGFTTLIIYNQVGEVVLKLLETELNTGRYNYEFNGTGLSSGIYYYRLTSGDYNETKKMVLLK